MWKKIRELVYVTMTLILIYSCDVTNSNDELLENNQDYNSHENVIVQFDDDGGYIVTDINGDAVDFSEVNLFLDQIVNGFDGDKTLFLELDLNQFNTDLNRYTCVGHHYEILSASAWSTYPHWHEINGNQYECYTRSIKYECSWCGDQKTLTDHSAL